MQNIIIVLGPICSGKDFLCQQLVENGHVERQISIGDIVRKVLDKEERIIDEQLDTDIIIELARTLSDSKSTVLNGIRQKTIFDWLLWHNKDYKIEVVYLDAPTHVLQERYCMRASKKDKIPFYKAYEKDMRLFGELSNFIVGPAFKQLGAKMLNTIEVKPTQNIYELYKETLQEDTIKWKNPRMVH